MAKMRMSTKPRIEAAAPAPLIAMARDASALADRTDANIAVVDVPCFAVAITGTAVGELGHPALIPSAAAMRNFSIFGVRNGGELLLIVDVGKARGDLDGTRQEQPSCLGRFL